MGFWIFMLIMVLLIPLMMIGFGRLWFYGGLALLPLIGSIIPTEMALRKNFDRDGMRRQRTEAKESGKS